MPNIKNLFLVGAAAVVGLTGCQTYHNRASGERSQADATQGGAACNAAPADALPLYPSRYRHRSSSSLRGCGSSQ